jgi:hypothetical protein
MQHHLIAILIGVVCIVGAVIGGVLTSKKATDAASEKKNPNDPPSEKPSLIPWITLGVAGLGALGFGVWKQASLNRVPTAPSAPATAGGTKFPTTGAPPPPPPPAPPLPSGATNTRADLLSQIQKGTQLRKVQVVQRGSEGDTVFVPSGAPSVALPSNAQLLGKGPAPAASTVASGGGGLDITTNPLFQKMRQKQLEESKIQ